MELRPSIERLAYRLCWGALIGAIVIMVDG